MRVSAQTVDEYIAGCPDDVQAVLERIRSIGRLTIRGGVERISYRMPAFERDGIVFYFAAFRNHIGIYPPVKGDAALMRALAPYRGGKGNLRFLLAEPIPYPLIRRVVRALLQANGKRRTARARPSRAR